MGQLEQKFLRGLQKVAELRNQVADAITGIPGYDDVEAVARTVTAPIRELARTVLRIFPAARRIEWLLEIERLIKMNPLLLSVTLAFVLWRGLRPTSLGHIGTDTLIYPLVGALSYFNPFLGVLSGIAYGIGDLAQKLVWNDIYGATGSRGLNYWGAMLGYVFSYSSLMAMGLIPGVLARVGRLATRKGLNALFYRRASATADGAAPATGAAAPTYPLAEAAVSLLGAAAGGSVVMGQLAPTLEAPAFYLRPDPDVSCHNLEVNTYLKGRALGAGGGGTAVGGTALTLGADPGSMGGQPPGQGGPSGSTENEEPTDGERRPGGGGGSYPYDDILDDGSVLGNRPYMGPGFDEGDGGEFDPPEEPLDEDGRTTVPGTCRRGHRVPVGSYFCPSCDAGDDGLKGFTPDEAPPEPPADTPGPKSLDDDGRTTVPGSCPEGHQVPLGFYFCPTCSTDLTEDNFVPDPDGGTGDGYDADPVDDYEDDIDPERDGSYEAGTDPEQDGSHGAGTNPDQDAGLPTDGDDSADDESSTADAPSYCAQCGQPKPSTAMFCPSCRSNESGSLVQCPVCSQSLGAGSTSCWACRQRFDPLEPGTPDGATDGTGATPPQQGGNTGDSAPPDETGSSGETGFCPQCGQAKPAGSMFCPSCRSNESGSLVQCPVCSQSLGAGSTSCWACRQRFDPLEPGTPDGGSAPASGATPPQADGETGGGARSDQAGPSDDEPTLGDLFWPLGETEPEIFGPDIGDPGDAGEPADGSTGTSPSDPSPADSDSDDAAGPTTSGSGDSDGQETGPVDDSTGVDAPPAGDRDMDDDAPPAGDRDANADNPFFDDDGRTTVEGTCPKGHRVPVGFYHCPGCGKDLDQTTFRPQPPEATDSAGHDPGRAPAAGAAGTGPSGSGGAGGERGSSAGAAGGTGTAHGAGASEPHGHEDDPTVQAGGDSGAGGQRDDAGSRATGPDGRAAGGGDGGSRSGEPGAGSVDSSGGGEHGGPGPVDRDSSGLPNDGDQGEGAGAGAGPGGDGGASGGDQASGAGHASTESREGSGATGGGHGTAGGSDPSSAGTGQGGSAQQSRGDGGQQTGTSAAETGGGEAQGAASDGAGGHAQGAAADTDSGDAQEATSDTDGGEGVSLGGVESGRVSTFDEYQQGAGNDPPLGNPGGDGTASAVDGPEANDVRPGTVPLQGEHEANFEPDGGADDDARRPLTHDGHCRVCGSGPQSGPVCGSCGYKGLDKSTVSSDRMSAQPPPAPDTSGTGLLERFQEQGIQTGSVVDASGNTHVLEPAPDRLPDGVSGIAYQTKEITLASGERVRVIDPMKPIRVSRS